MSELIAGATGFGAVIPGIIEANKYVIVPAVLEVVEKGSVFLGQDKQEAE